jgi:RNA polymerase sigma-70 factor (ECF subfamily)
MHPQIAMRGDGAPRVSAPELLQAAIDEHAGVLYRLALSIVRDPALADDVVQETLIKAWRHAPVDGHGTVPRAWLMRVARNTAISLLRTRREDMYGDDAIPERPSGITVARTVEGRAALDDLRRALETLDEDARALIVLREIDGLSYEDIAAAMELPLPTVKTRLFRARQALKRALEAWQ